MRGFGDTLLIYLLSIYLFVWLFSALGSVGVYLLLLLLLLVCRFECLCCVLCLNLSCLVELF